MQNENSEAQSGQQDSTADNTRIKDDLTQLEHEIHDALVDGVNIRETVHNLTLRAINADRLNIDSIRRITTAVVNGVHEGAQKQLVAASNQTEAAKSQITEAVSGLIPPWHALPKQQSLQCRKPLDALRNFLTKN